MAEIGGGRGSGPYRHCPNGGRENTRTTSPESNSRAPKGARARPVYYIPPPMIIGNGIDIVAVERLERLRERFGGRGRRRLFTEAELEYAVQLATPGPSLAARFAAKEDCSTAIGAAVGGEGVVRRERAQTALHRG